MPWWISLAGCFNQCGLSSPWKTKDSHWWKFPLQWRSTDNEYNSCKTLQTIRGRDKPYQLRFVMDENRDFWRFWWYQQPQDKNIFTDVSFYFVRNFTKEQLIFIKLIFYLARVNHFVANHSKNPPAVLNEFSVDLSPTTIQLTNHA